MKIGEAVIVLDDLREGETPERAIGDGAEKHDLARPEGLVAKSLAVPPDHKQRQRRQRDEQRGKSAEADEMLEREEREADKQHARRARDPRKGT